MSTEDDLKVKLLNLECHFTWDLREEDFSLEDLVNRLDEQIKLESEEARVTRAYSSLAFVSYLYGDRYAALTNLHKSEELAKKYYGEDSDKFLIVTYRDLAWLYYHMEHFALVEDYLKLLDQICMKLSSDEVHSEVLREKGWAFLKFCRRYYNGARECFRQALNIKPEDSDLNAGYAIALYRTTTDPPNSQESLTVAQLRRAIHLNPKDAVLLLFLAIRLLSINKNPTSPKSAIHDPSQLMKQSGEAISLVVRALEMSPENPHVSRYVAQFSRKLGSVDFAIRQLEESHIPDSAFIHHQLALCYKQKKISLEKKYRSCQKVDNYEAHECLQKCIRHLERAVSLKPGFICALAELAVHYGQIKDIPKAEMCFQQAFQLSKEKKDLQTVHAMYGQFQLYSKGSEQLAIYNYMEGLKLQADTPEGKKCETELKQIVQHRFSKNPSDSKAWAIDGFIHELKGENFKAAECYEKALTNDTGIGERLLLAEVRIWLLGFMDAEKSARNVILGCHTHNEEALGTGRPVILRGQLANKPVYMVETDLCKAKKILTREKSILAPGPHVIVLAFHHDGEVNEDIKHALEDLEIFGQSFWKHVVVLFTNEETCIRGQESVLQWLLEKCGYRYYIAGTGTKITQTMELSDRIMNMISRNNTIHLIIPAIPSTSSSLKMLKESEKEKSGSLTPEKTTEMGKPKYRLQFSHAGWFHCKSTHLGFKMNGEGEVLYSTVDQDSSCPVSTNHYAAGPLYEIKCVRGELSQLQLPHCEISPGNDCDFMTVAHYTDDSEEVLKPDYITHTHVTVSVPETSKFRIVDRVNLFKKKIRGQVILVYHPSPTHHLQVFLRPWNVDPKKLCENGGRLILAPCDCYLKHACRYKMFCEDIEEPQRTPMVVYNDGLFLRNKYTIYPTFEIHLENTMNVKLRLRPEHGKAEEVWKNDFLSFKAYQSISVEEMNEEKCMSFVMDNFAELVNRVTNVDAILDLLVRDIHGGIMSDVRCQRTREDKIRKLMLVVGKTLPAVKFYKSLQAIHPDLVKNMMD